MKNHHYKYESWQVLARSLFISVLMISAAFALAQTVTVRGIVLDDTGAAVSFANVYLAEVYDGGSTDESGAFEFTTTAKGEQILVISCLGYETVQRDITLDNELVEMEIEVSSGVTTLNEVVIAAGSFEAGDAYKTTILKPLDIVQNPVAAGDLYGAIATLPGVTPVGDETGIFVRGGEATETKTIIDGTIVDKPFFSEVPDIPSRGRFNPFLFKGTMFSTGGYSAEYGQALSSVLVLSTQDIPSASSTGIGANLAGVTLSGTRVWKGKTAFLANIGYTNLKPYFDIIPQRRDWVTPPKGYGGAIGFRHKWDNGGLFKTYAQLSVGENAINLDNPNDPNAPTQFRINSDNIYVNSSYTGILADKWSIYAGMSISKDNQDLHIGTFDIQDESMRLQAKTTIGREIASDVYLRFGGELQWRDVFGSFATSNEVFDGSWDGEYGAVFVESDIKLNKKIALRLGLRGEHEGVLDRRNLAPRTSVAYKTGDQSQISLAYGIYYQTPETDFERGFAGLGFERATHYIFNYQWLSDEYTFRIEAYHKDYDDLIKYQNVPPGGEGVLRNNAGDGHARGVDIFWRDQKTIEKLDYWISYSFIDASRDYKEFPGAAVPSFINKHNISLVSKYQFSQRLRMGLGYTFASGRPYDDPNTAEFLDQRTPKYYNMSVNGSYLFNVFNQFTVLYVSVSNPFGWEQIFNYRYSDDGTRRIAIIPSTKRSAFIGFFISIS